MVEGTSVTIEYYNSQLEDEIRIVSKIEINAD